jgi:hypothetical protein
LSTSTAPMILKMLATLSRYSCFSSIPCMTQCTDRLFHSIGTHAHTNLPNMKKCSKELVGVSRLVNRDELQFFFVFM